MGLTLTLALALIITLTRRGDKPLVISSGAQRLGTQLHLVGAGVRNSGRVKISGGVISSGAQPRACCATRALGACYGCSRACLLTYLPTYLLTYYGLG